MQSLRNVASSSSYDDGQAPKLPGTIRLGRTREEEEASNVALLGEQTCPVCHQENQANDIYCFECGFLLSSTLEDSNSLPRLDEHTRSPHLEDSTGRFFTLRPGINTVGRENTDILLPDRSVSRYHATIVYDEERGIYSIEDSGSTNGSTLNGESLSSHKPRALKPGDQISFGNILLRFVSETKTQTGTAAIAGEPIFDADEPTLPTGTPLEHTVSKSSARLILLRGVGEREFALQSGINSIGRQPDNTICLTGDRYVSGHHARIEVESDLYLLLDVGSTNGTFLNGLRLTTNAAIAISEGDEVLIGGNLFQFHKQVHAQQQDRDISERTLLGAPSFDLLAADVISSDQLSGN